jgi:restriction endonuclease S subunit
MKRSQHRGGELLYTMAGTIGIAAIFPRDFGTANINQAIAKIILKKEVNNKYIKFVLNSKFCKAQAQRFLTTAAQPNINFEQIKSIRIPFPSCQIQEEIVNLMNEAYRIKREKEAKAEEILNSIDDYVLDELGIKLPLLEEKKNFAVTFAQVRGKRLDPYGYQPKFERVYAALGAGGHELMSIGELIVDISGGATPKAKGDAYAGPDGIPFLRIQNVTPDGISFEEMNYINQRTHEGPLKRSQLQTGDVVFTITGRIGTVAVIPKALGKGNINQHMVRLRFKEEVLPEYFSAFFNTDFGNQQALRLTSGGSRIALDYKAIRSLRIPIPPLLIQQRIVQQVESRREKGKELKKEAREILVKARQEMEKMILGGND